MKLERFGLGIYDTNCYIIIDEESKKAAVIDPGDAPDEFLNYFEKKGYELEGILLTHGHWDHITGVEKLVAKYGVKIYAMQQEKELLLLPQLNGSIQHREEVSLSVGIEFLEGGETLEFAGCVIKVIATPGHTAGGCCYYIAEENVLFSGDTLFANTVGRWDLPTGSERVLKQSIREKLYILPEETVVYPGHMQSTTIGHEKKYNEEVR